MVSRVFHALLILVFLDSISLGSSTPVAAQNVPEFGGMMGAAIAEQQRAEWTRMSRQEQACFNIGLRQNNLNLQQVIASGISPNDGRLSSLRQTCDGLESRKLRVNVQCPIEAGGVTVQSRCDEAFVSSEDRTRKLVDEDLYEAAFSHDSLQTALIERPDAQRRREQMTALGGASGAVPTPNFDCARAKKDDEVAICNSAPLSALDGEYGTLYRRADSGAKNNPVRKLGVQLYQDRQKCGGDEDCIRQNLERSITSMAKILRRRGEVVETSLDRARAIAAQQAAQMAEERKTREQEARQAAEQAAASRALAEKEAARAAELPSLISRGNALVKEASEFLRSDRPSKPHLLLIAESIASLNAALNAKDNDKITDGVTALERQLHDDPKYQMFVTQKADAQAQENVRLMADAIAQVTKQKKFLESYIAQNAAAPASAKAIGLVRSADQALDSKDLGVLQRQRSAVEALLRDFDLQNNYLLSLNAVDDADSSSEGGASATTGLVKTAKNRFVLDGAADDLVLMYIAAPTAPHVVKNLRGEVVFDDSAASVCIFDSGPTAATRDRVSKIMERYALRDLQVSAAPCTPVSLLNYDVIALERGEYLKQDLAYAAVLTKEIENDHIKPLLQVSGEQNEQELQSIEAKRKQIEIDIAHQSFDGYALILLPAFQSGAVCGALKQELDAHRALIDGIADPRIGRLKQNLRLDYGSFDDIYADVQRAKCGAIYGAGPDLKSTLEALRRDQVTYQFF